MATNRFQFSDDFTLNNGNVGINTATPQTKLDVDGVVKGESLKVTGVSSFTTYEGFLNSNQNIVENTTISGGGRSGSLSGEIIVGTGITVTVASDTTSSQGSVDSLKVYNTFTVPVGGTTDRPSKATPGQLFFNRDFATMEFWDGDRWRQVDNTTQRGRGVFGGGRNSGGTNVSTTDFITISSTGNAQDFGNLTQSRAAIQGASSNIRGVFGGGATPTRVNTIEYITIASEGNGIDFGDLITSATAAQGTLSSQTRGVFALGSTPTSVNTMEYIQISTLGNALDFGDTKTSGENGGVCASPTRGIFFGNAVDPKGIIEFITIASTGNATDFGRMDDKRSSVGLSNSTRGICAGGTNPSGLNSIEYVTISSIGNAIDFGELISFAGIPGGCSNSTRGVVAGSSSPSVVNIIQFITISTLGNAQDFGDLSLARWGMGGVSDSHGGLGGF
jgi:hypothetical protein